MSTRVTNLTAALATLPYPYRGAIGPGRGVVLSDDMQTVLDNLGGPLQIESVFRLDLSEEPGSAANDPSPAAPSKGYTADGVGGPILPAASASGGTVAAPVWAFYTGPGGADPKIPIFSDGVHWYDPTGATVTP